MVYVSPAGATERRRIAERDGDLAIAAEEARNVGATTDTVLGAGGGLRKAAVTSMHICARIFAWAWDLLVGSGAYPMQQVSLLSAFNPNAGLPGLQA